MLSLIEGRVLKYQQKKEVNVQNHHISGLPFGMSPIDAVMCGMSETEGNR